MRKCEKCGMRFWPGEFEYERCEKCRSWRTKMNERLIKFHIVELNGIYSKLIVVVVVLVMAAFLFVQFWWAPHEPRSSVDDLVDEEQERSLDQNLELLRENTR